MINVIKELPERGKKLSVLMNDNFCLFEAYLFDKDWYFSSSEHARLNIKNMNDHYELGKKITHWTYK